MRISNDKRIYSMSRHNIPVTYASPGDIIVFETMDCYDGMVDCESESGSNIDQTRINPATGPVYINGAETGDVLVVDILDIKIKGRGIMRISPSFGTLTEMVKCSKFKIINISNGKIYFKDNYKIDINPMIGVIGTAPGDFQVENETPGDHGGNMDTNDIAIGSRVYLPISVEGGLLAIGDVHARMGDGEVSGTGVEVSADVTVKVNILKNTKQKRPFVETSSAYYCICSAETLEKASKTAVEDAVSFIMNKLGFSFEDAYMLVSIGCNLKISQIVDPLMTVRMEIPKGLIFKEDNI